MNGCDSEWPPRADEISNFVIENSEQFERLEQILIETGYDRISRSIIQDQVQVRTGRGANGIDETLEGKQEWNDLLKQLKAYNVEKRENGIWFLGGNAGDGNNLATVAYVHDSKAESRYDICSETRPSDAEGECLVKVDDEWFIYYWWHSAD